MAFSFTPTYQDYLRSNPQNNGGSESGGFSGFSQDQWGAMDASQQWNNMGGGLALGTDDPRYAAIAEQLKMTNGRSIRLAYNPGYKPGDTQNVVDPSRVLSGSGITATPDDNLTPAAQFAGGGLSDKGWALAALSLFGGGAALGAAGLTGEAAGGLTGGGLDAAGAGGSIVGNAGLPGYAGAFDEGGALGFGGTTPLGTAGATTGSIVGNAGNPSYAGAFDGGGSTGFGGTSPLSGNSSLLSQLNTGRQYFNGARSVMSLLNGGQGGSRSGGMGTDFSSVLSSLFGGGSGGSGLSGLLGLLANGHQMFGGGVGTASGAQAAADKASGLADPWGASGRRGQFSDILTPDKAMSLMSQDPSAVLNNPAYKFELGQGTNAINMGDAAQGTLRSGNRGVELAQYGQGLASKYGQQYFNNNMTTLNALSGLAGVNAGSPTAAAASQLNGFDNASNIRNSGINGLFGGGANGGMGALGSLLSSLGGGASGLWSALTGGGGFDMSGVNFGNLPAFNDTSGFNPGDYFTDTGGGFADATGAWF